MSVVFSGTLQGVFTSTGVAKILELRTDVDWLKVYNYSATSAQVGSTGLEFYWQRGMAAGTGLEWQLNAGSTAITMLALASGGFTLVNNTVSVPGAAIALTAISGATPPVVATGNTAPLSNGDIVRLYNVVGAQQVTGLDFTIGGIISNTSFTLAFMRGIAAAAAPGASAVWRRIPYDPYFYPPTRVISKIRAVSVNGAQAAQVTMTVTHSYTVGQKIRFIIPTVTAAAFGMVELNQVEATIIAINTADVDGVTNTITVDVDVSGFTAFAWPLNANPRSTPPQVVPVGENTSEALSSGVNPFQDAELNLGFIGISLAAGINSPAGQANDVIYWVAGKSYNGV